MEADYPVVACSEFFVFIFRPFPESQTEPVPYDQITQFTSQIVAQDLPN